MVLRAARRFLDEHIDQLRTTKALLKDAFQLMIVPRWPKPRPDELEKHILTTDTYPADAASSWIEA